MSWGKKKLVRILFVIAGILNGLFIYLEDPSFPFFTFLALSDRIYTEVFIVIGLPITLIISSLVGLWKPSSLKLIVLFTLSLVSPCWRYYGGAYEREMKAAGDARRNATFFCQDGLALSFDDSLLMMTQGLVNKNSEFIQSYVGEKKGKSLLIQRDLQNQNMSQFLSLEYLSKLLRTCKTPNGKLLSDIITSLDEESSE